MAKAWFGQHWIDANRSNQKAWRWDKKAATAYLFPCIEVLLSELVSDHQMAVSKPLNAPTPHPLPQVTSGHESLSFSLWPSHHHPHFKTGQGQHAACRPDDTLNPRTLEWKKEETVLQEASSWCSTISQHISECSFEAGQSHQLFVTATARLPVSRCLCHCWDQEWRTTLLAGQEEEWALSMRAVNQELCLPLPTLVRLLDQSAAGLPCTDQLFPLAP